MEKVLLTRRMAANIPIMNFFELGNIPQHQLDNLMLLGSESLLLPELRPDGLPEDATTWYANDLTGRLLITRMAGQWSVDGKMVDNDHNAVVGVLQWLSRPFRRRQMREAMAAENESNPEDEFA